LFLVSLFTSVITELVTNNAAAAIGIPFAVEIAKSLEVSYRPFALTVLIMASCSFATPIGYQVNTMIWAPGGYKFSDFTKIGLPINLLFVACTTFITPIFFPF